VYCGGAGRNGEVAGQFLDEWLAVERKAGG
jgi:hypothetical protein